MQTLSRRDDVAELTAGYGLIVADECHHVPAAAFEHAVKQIPARRWLGLTATPYRRDKLDDLIAMQVGPVRHTIALSRDAAGQDTLLGTGRPAPVLYVHPTAYRYDGDADVARPGGMTTIYRHLAADEQRARQVTADVLAALSKDRNCLVLTNRTSHLERSAGLLREAGRDPVILRGGKGAKSRAAALALFLAAPVASKGSLTQYVGRILRSDENKTTAEVHDYLDERTGVLAAMLAKRAPGYAGLGFSDPRRLALTPSASTDS